MQIFVDRRPEIGKRSRNVDLFEEHEMTKAQKRLRELRERQSKDRQRMAELAMAEGLTDETRAELDTLEKGVPDLERQLRAAETAVAAEEDEGETRAKAEGDLPDGEMRERLELRSKASLTAFLRSAISGKRLDGAEAELREAAGAEGIPLELWDVPARRSMEHRQDDATAAPGTVGVNLAPIRPMIFANSIAPRLGIEMPRVSSGTYATATITTKLTAGAKAKGAAQEATAAALTVTTAVPMRVSGRFAVRIEDIASVGQANFEGIHREHLSMVMSDALDNFAINGVRADNAVGDAGAQPKGIFAGLTDAKDPTAVADFDAFAAAHANGVDGLWASTIKDISIVVGKATYQLAGRTFQSATNYKGELSAAAYATLNTGGFWTNDRMPAADGSNFQKAILHRKGRMGVRTAVCPHWGELGIDDIYSGSAKGERYLTLHVLVGDVAIVQQGAYAALAYQVA